MGINYSHRDFASTYFHRNRSAKMKGKGSAHDKNAFWRSATVHTRKKISVKAFLLRINVRVHWRFEERRNCREMKSLSKNNMSMLRIRNGCSAVPYSCGVNWKRIVL
ncbi:hypothetical protein CEXT_758421 [Caerostris extrusa]|uniref:Uncharacterized protein n=1 Tax=Caerostris extrusa TaxID=172846 RepID=A0AAV4N3X0_CAEEX|nr:hypothetical protein CEXT_758421 [Caerostris extrusa]